jgi:hypothetical protein
MTTRLVVVMRDAGQPGQPRMDEQCGARVAQVVETQLLREAGAGHSSIRVTSDRYGHLFPPARQELADGLEETHRNAAPAGGAGVLPLAPRLSTRGRLESLNRAFSGDCNYPVEEPLPMRALEEGGGGRPGQGSPAFLASAPNSE